MVDLFHEVIIHNVGIYQKQPTFSINQEARLQDLPHASCNADMGSTEVRKYRPLDETGHQLVGAAMRQLGLSARAYHRILKLARTNADLVGAERIEPAHIDS